MNCSMNFPVYPTAASRSTPGTSAIIRLRRNIARGCGKATESAIGFLPFWRLPGNALEYAGTNEQSRQQGENYRPSVETQIGFRARRRLLHRENFLNRLSSFEES